MTRRHKIRILISDVDGTLLNSEGKLSDADCEAVRRLGQAGVKFSLSSARPQFGLHWLIQMLQVKSVCSGLNGAILFQPDGQVVAKTGIDRRLAETLVARMREKHGLDVWLYTQDEWFVARFDGPHVQSNTAALRTNAQRYFSLSEVSNPILKIVGTSDNLAAVAACETELSFEYGDRISVSRSQPHYVDVTSRLVDKGQAAVVIAVAEGLEMDEVATIGDSPSDIPMFQAAGLSIAMGQASNDVRRASTRVTLSNNENGVAWAIDYLLNENRNATKTRD